MSAQELEQTLRNLSRIGQRIKDRGYRQVWRFEHQGRPYFLKFYHKHGFRDAFRRAFRGSPAMAEFTRLQRLAAAKIPAPRAVAVMMGFKLDGQTGDAVILEAIEPSVQLDEYFNDFELRGQSPPDRLDIAKQVREILRGLARNRLSHEDLHLGNFLLKEGKVYLLDGYALRSVGLTLKHLLYLGHSASRYATRTDLLRAWIEVGPGGKMPPVGAGAPDSIASVMRGRVFRDNRYVGRIRHEEWSGSFFKFEKFPRRWSPASALRPTQEDWARELPGLIARIERDELPALKRSKSGDVFTAHITIGAAPIDVIVKRPKRRYWYRYFNEIGRGSRACRAWFKAWLAIGHNLPTAWPLMYADRRRYGYVVDSLIVFERVPGPTLARVDFAALAPAQRETLLRRAGRVLRRIDALGMAHFDAKSANWIVRPDDVRGPTPIMIDIDGIRQRRWHALGIRRLLRSMRDNKTYASEDSLSLCLGYAPFAPPKATSRQAALEDSAARDPAPMPGSAKEDCD